MIDVIGQILRNRAGSLLRPQLRDLAKSGYESGLKFLRFWLDITQRDQKDLISVIYESLKEEWRDELSNDVIPKAATRTYLALTYGVCFAVIRRIAYSLGSEELLEIFETLEKEDPDSVAIRMINVAIRLEFTKKIPSRSQSTQRGSCVESDRPPIASTTYDRAPLPESRQRRRQAMDFGPIGDSHEISTVNCRAKKSKEIVR
jgi:hypothetical protein